MKPTNKALVVQGSGNVFADLDLPDADDLQTKAELTRQLYRRIKALGLSQVKAAKALGVKQPDVSKLMNGRFTGFSVERLLELLNALAVDVDIVLRPQATRPSPRHRQSLGNFDVIGEEPGTGALFWSWETTPSGPGLDSRRGTTRCRGQLRQHGASAELGPPGQ